ncbi:MAG: aminotransferase class I/II-fold pyridoxal phosphate-dependent enzyme [Caldilineales bacterium]|nr:aminotransferase class I/II-fold pyridoxal phosphate-dependent enzyme [Caldilineales bacterium]
MTTASTTAAAGDNGHHTPRQRISPRVAAVPPSGLRRFFDIAATMDDVISLSIGEPDFTTPQVILQAGIDSLQRGQTQYTSNSGIYALRAALSDYLHRLYGVAYDPETEILITVGSSEALYLTTVALLDVGDEVIVPQPSYVAYPAEVAFTGAVSVPVSTFVEDDFRVTAAEIAAAITPATKALLLGYPCNPTGAALDRADMLGIAQLAAGRDLLVIADEIYDRLTYVGEHTCFASLPGMKDRTILLGGLSKSHAMTGWRLGWACAPADILAAMRKVHQYTIMSAPTVAQVAAITALTDPRAEEAVATMRQSYDERRRLIVDGLNSIGLPTFTPRGAFYAFPSIRASGLDDNTFAETLLQEEHVAVIPGSAFGAAGAGYVRCCYAQRKDKIEVALDRMAAFVRRHG